MSESPNILARVHFYNPDSPKRDFYSSQDVRSGDYLNYVDTASAQGKVQDYMDYAGNKEKATGAFSTDGLLNAKEKTEIRKQLKDSKSVIWDMIVSFKEEFGKEKMKSWRNAYELIRKELPIFLKDNNIPIDNVIWFAGLHENTDNRHIHISFFEKEPVHMDGDSGKKRFRHGKLSKESLEDFKIRVERRLNGHEYSLHSYRDQLIQAEEKKLLEPDQAAVRDKELKEMLLEVYRKLPKGKYGYENHALDEIRPDLDKITTHIITGDDTSMYLFMGMIRKLKKRDHETKEICERSKISPKGHLISEEFKKDLYRRCGNVILNYLRNAQDLKGEFHKGRTEEEKERWDEKVRRKWLFSRTTRLNRQLNRESMDIFDDFERKLEQAEYERLIEEGVIEAE